MNPKFRQSIPNSKVRLEERFQWPNFKNERTVNPPPSSEGTDELFANDRLRAGFRFPFHRSATGLNNLSQKFNSEISKAGHHFNFRSKSLREFGRISKKEAEPHSTEARAEATANRRPPLLPLPNGIKPLWNVDQTRESFDKFFKKGGKLDRAFHGAVTSISSLSQHFRGSTKKRYKLDNSPYHTPRRTPPHPYRVTPGKLYSPFNLNTPATPRSYTRAPKRLQNSHHRRSFGSDNLALCRTPPNFPPAIGRMHWSSFESPMRPVHHDDTAHYRMNSIR